MGNGVIALQFHQFKVQFHLIVFSARVLLCAVWCSILGKSDMVLMQKAKQILELHGKRRILKPQHLNANNAIKGPHVRATSRANYCVAK